MMKHAIAMSLAILSTPTWGQSPADLKDEDSLIRTAMVCMRRAATRLEPSGESPQDIAEAALWVCDSERIALSNWQLRHPPGFSNEANERGVAVAQVVGVRLCKKTKDCFFAATP